MKNVCCVLILLLVLAGCKVRRPDGVIPESQMEELLYDYHLAKAMGENLSGEDNYKKGYLTLAHFKNINKSRVILKISNYEKIKIKFI